MSLSRPDTPALRAGVLAVSVLDDVDLTPSDAGVCLDGARPVAVGWSELAEIVGPHEPTGPVGRHRLSVALQLHRVVAEAGPDAAVLLRSAARLLALPADHALHPGADWTRAGVRGGAVTCGVGVTGLTSEPDEVVPLPPGVAVAAGADPACWWPDLTVHAERMGAIVVARLERDHGIPAGSRTTRRAPVRAHEQAVLRPVGGVDVLSLLTTHVLRTYLGRQDGTGMRAVAVPMRTRGWYDLAHVDPAFVGAAWSATDDVDRGLDRAVLVTSDDMVLPRHGALPGRRRLSPGGLAARG